MLACLLACLFVCLLAAGRFVTLMAGKLDGWMAGWAEGLAFSRIWVFFLFFCPDWQLILLLMLFSLGAVNECHNR